MFSELPVLGGYKENSDFMMKFIHLGKSLGTLSSFMVNLVMGLFRSTFDSIQLMGVGLQNCCFGLSRESQSYGPCVVDWGNPKCCCKFEVQLC